MNKLEPATLEFIEDVVNRCRRYERPLVDGTHLYFAVAENGMVKIGRSRNPHKRIKELRANSPIDVSLIGIAWDCGCLESVLLHILRNFRVRGEWLLGDPIVLDTIYFVLGMPVFQS